MPEGPAEPLLSHSGLFLTLPGAFLQQELGTTSTRHLLRTKPHATSPSAQQYFPCHHLQEPHRALSSHKKLPVDAGLTPALVSPGGAL